MSRPKSNAPSNMAPWVKATEKDIDALQRKVADIERSATGPTSSSSIGVGSAEVISIAQSVEGAISATLSNVSFDTDTTMESNLQIDGTLSVGNATRFQLVDVGGIMESLPYEAPSFSMTGADEVVNPVTGATEFTPGYLSLNDVEVTGSNIHGIINASGLKLHMQDKGGTWYYPDEIRSNLQGVDGFMTITVLGNNKPDAYVVGAYIAIINGGVYTTPKTAIYAVSYDVPSDLLSITVATPYTDFVASGNAVIMQTFGYDAIPNTIELYNEEGVFGTDYTYISSRGVYVGTEEQPPATGPTYGFATVQITPTGITTSEVLTATGLVDAGLLDVGGGYGSTGTTIDADGNITTNGYLDVDSSVRVGGGYAANGSGTTLGSNGSISSNGNMLVEGTATFQGTTLVQTASGNGARVYVSDSSAAIGGFRPYIAGTGDATADFLWNNTTSAWNSDQGLSTNARTGVAATQAAGVHLHPDGYGLFTRSNATVCYIHRYGTSGTSVMVQFLYNGANNGTINVASGGTPAFASGSDYRIKEDVQPVTDALERMKGIQAYTFRKIKEVDPEQNLQTGFIAHEVAAVHPEAVIGEKDAVDEDGNPEYQQVMDAKLTPLMAQAIKELILKNEALEARIAALEAR